MSEATLLIIQGPEQGQRFDLLDDVVSIGRGARNGIRILDTEISRQHAEIFRAEDGWRIRDLGSSNGTWVNGQPISEMRLQSGQQIQIGRTILLFGVDANGTEAQANQQIDLVPQSAVEDHSRIVGQAYSRDSSLPANIAQAGANLQILYRITEEAVRPTSSRDELLKRILDLTLDAVGADRGCMLVADSKTDRIAPRVVSQRANVDVNQRMPISTSIVEYVIAKGQGVRTSDARHDSRFEGGMSIMKSGIREAMCVPMQGRYELMGVIYVDTTSAAPHLQAEPGNRFNDQQLRLLLAIGRQSALAIENFRYQDALVTAERLAAIGQTIAILSHHIKNILQGFRGGSYLIDLGLKQKNEEMVRQGWAILDKNQERIYNLVMDMLTFSKERQPRMVPADVGSVINDVLELMQSRLTEAGIAVSVQEVTPVVRSAFDPEGMHRAVLNIVTNAIDALQGRDSPALTIRRGMSEDGGRLWIEIEDNGPGIHPDELPALFQLFESSKGNRGTGLGLAVSKKILQEHGGDITVRTAQGQGTCFRLEWPVHVEEADSAEGVSVPAV